MSPLVIQIREVEVQSVGLDGVNLVGASSAWEYLAFNNMLRADHVLVGSPSRKSGLKGELLRW